MKLPLKLICPAEDPSWSELLTTEREVQICRDIASRLKLAINIDEAAGKLYLGRLAPAPTPKPSTQINAAGLALIKNSEGLRLSSYADAAGVWTVGYGHTGNDVTPGMTISQTRAEELLRSDLARFELGVAATVKVPVSANQFAALVSLAYNIGLTAFGSSTLLRKLNAGDAAGAAEQFGQWTYAGGRSLAGLVARRQKERDLFLSDQAPPAGASVQVIPLKQHRDDSCGQASVAMAINTLTGKKLDDNDIDARYGYFLLDALNAECPNHVWADPLFTPASWTGIEQRLKAGRPTLIALNGPDFSPSGRGHVLLICRLVGDLVYMADPATGTIRSWTRAQVESAKGHPQGKWLMWALPKS